MSTRVAGRLAATTVVVLLGAAACSGPEEDAVQDLVVVSPQPSSEPTPAASGPPSSPATVDDAPTATRPPSTATAAPRPAPTATTTPTGASTPALTPADDMASVGANARALLRPDRPRIVLEVDTQEGTTPAPGALGHLVDVLDDVLDKPGGIVREGGNTFADTRTRWSTADLRRAAAATRDTATTDDHVSVQVLYVAGAHVEDGEQTDAIGLAISASTVVLFPDRWQGLTSLLGSGEAVERAVLVHELGHLLALVNLGYVSDIDHEDPDHPGHSANRGSVMFHAIESTLIGRAFDGPPPDRFDDADLADLEGLRTGRL